MAEIRFVMGRAHSGKSAFVYDECAKNTNSFDCERYIFLVPDQMSLAAEKELLKRKAPKRSLYRIDVWGFTRMAYRLCEEQSYSIPTVIDEVGKLLLIERALQKLDKEGNLSIFKGNAGRSGFIKAMSGLLKEMTEYRITDEAALNTIAELPDKKLLAGKITDILKIRKAYEELKGSSFITAEDILARVVGIVGKSGFLSGANVVVDGFSAFTPLQYEVLAEIMKIAKTVTFVLDIDVKEEGNDLEISPLDENSIFYESRRTYDRLNILAEKLGISNVVKKGCFGKHHDSCSALVHLEQHYEQDVKEYSGIPEQIVLTECYDLSDEIDDVLAQITALTADGKYHYRDISIITTDADSYAELIDEKFGRVGIPYFTDHRKSLFHNIVIEGLLSAVAVCDQDFSYDALFRYLRSGLFSDYENIDKLDIYVRALGIRGSRAYKNSFTDRKRKPDRYDIEDVESLDRFKSAVLKSVLELHGSLKSKKLSDKISAVKQWLEETGVWNILLEKTDSIEKSGDHLLATQYAQTKELTERILDQINGILGEEEVANAELYKLLEMGFESLGVGVLPSYLDVVTIGDMKRSRLSDVKVLFVIGMNDKVFPAGVSDIGLLSDNDRELLMGTDGELELEETAKLQTIVMKYFIYRCLVKPSEKLYLSYCKTGKDQKSIFPSYVVGQIRKLFPDLMTRKAKKAIYHPRQGLLAVARPDEYDFDDQTVAAIRAYYESNGIYSQEYNKICDAARVNSKVAEVIDENKALALFGPERDEKPGISVSRLESFAGCPMKHFLQYGMNIMPRQEYEIKAFDIGNIYHDILDRFFKTVSEKKMELKEFNDERVLDSLIDKLMIEATEAGRFDFSVAGSKNEYMYEQMKDVIRNNLKIIIYQLSKGRMKPLSTECSFGMKNHDVHSYPAYDIEDSPFKLKGKIDRVDVLEEDDQNIYRVIDYKSGKTSFNETKVAEGLQLQLMVYLSAILNSEKNRYAKDAVAAGAFYYHITEDVPELSADEIKAATGEKKSDEEIAGLIWEKTVKEKRLEGIAAAERHTLGAMDSSLMEDKDVAGVESNVVKVGYTKKSELKANSKAYEKAAIERVLNATEAKVAELGKGILSGNTNAAPYEDGQMNACLYCEFSGRCGFDEKLNGTFRKLTASLPFADEVKLTSEEGKKGGE